MEFLSPAKAKSKRSSANLLSLYNVYLDICNWLFIYTGQAYNLEKQSEPGISVDLDSTLASMDTLEFCLVRENSKSKLFTFYILKSANENYSVNPNQTVTEAAVWSGFTLFAELYLLDNMGKISFFEFLIFEFLFSMYQ